MAKLKILFHYFSASVLNYCILCVTEETLCFSVCYSWTWTQTSLQKWTCTHMSCFTATKCVVSLLCPVVLYTSELLQSFFFVFLLFRERTFQVSYNYLYIISQKLSSDQFLSFLPLPQTPNWYWATTALSNSRLVLNCPDFHLRQACWWMT